MPANRPGRNPARPRARAAHPGLVFRRAMA